MEATPEIMVPNMDNPNHMVIKDQAINLHIIMITTDKMIHMVDHLDHQISCPNHITIVSLKFEQK